MSAGKRSWTGASVPVKLSASALFRLEAGVSVADSVGVG